MASVTKLPTSGTTIAVAPENANAWIVPMEITFEDGVESYISAPSYDTGDISYRLRGSAFGFAIPAGSSIDGIVLEINRWAINGGAKDYRVQFQIGTTLVGDNKASPDAWPTLAAETKSYGGATDTWGRSWTVDEINENGAALFAIMSAEATAENTDVLCDFFKVTVYYTPPSVAAVRVVASEANLIYNAPARVVASETVLIYSIPVRVVASEAVLDYAIPVRVVASEAVFNYIIPVQVTASEIVFDYIGTAQIVASEVILIYAGDVVHSPYGAEFLYEGANWAGKDLFFEAFMRATAGTIHARLYDVTADSPVIESEVSTTEVSFTRVRSGAIKSALVDGHSYRAQFGKGVTDTGEFISAKLIGV